MEYMGIDVSFLVNGADANLNPTEYVLSMSDSIHLTFPELSLGLKDPTGMIHEMGVFLLGIPLEASITVNEDSVQSAFRVSKRETLRNTTYGQLSGDLSVSAVHKSFFDMTTEKKSFKNTVSSVVSEIMKPLFSAVKVEATDGKGIFYKFETEDEFLREVLLPNALSSDNKKTPYVAFGSLDGNFYFQSLGLLMEQSPVTKLTLNSVSGASTVVGTVTGFLPFTEDITRCLDSFAHATESFKEGAYASSASKVIDGFTGKLPFLGTNTVESDEWTGTPNNPDIEYEKFEEARRYDACRKAFFLERALVFTAEDPKLVSGKIIDLSVYLQDVEKKESPSEYYSGNWLIERSNHSWMGSSGRTLLVVVRPSVTPITDSLLSDGAFS